MLSELINHSPDLQRLQNEGFDIDVKSGYLVVSSIPYVQDNRLISIGNIATALSLSGNQTTRPRTHVAYFNGSHPCHKNGTNIGGLVNGSANIGIDGLNYNISMSNKPQGGYPDYYELIKRYTDIICGEAASIDSSKTPCVFKPIKSDEDVSVFNYIDTNSSRSGVQAVSGKLTSIKVGIVGCGGTGAYILDCLTKSPFKEIHIFDGDDYLQHNAFRCPGAATIEDLRAKPTKVEYLKKQYSNLHKNIIAHGVYLSKDTFKMLESLDYVFICVDRGSIKEDLFSYLRMKSIPFNDVGMGVDLCDDKLSPTLRVTVCDNEHFDHIEKNVSFTDGDDDIYTSNIQIGELNMLNAAMAVIEMKKYFEFYLSQKATANLTYDLSLNLLCRE